MRWDGEEGSVEAISVARLVSLGVDLPLLQGEGEKVSRPRPESPPKPGEKWRDGRGQEFVVVAAPTTPDEGELVQIRYRNGRKAFRWLEYFTNWERLR